MKQVSATDTFYIALQGINLYHIAIVNLLRGTHSAVSLRIAIGFYINTEKVVMLVNAGQRSSTQARPVN